MALEFVFNVYLFIFYAFFIEDVTIVPDAEQPEDETHTNNPQILKKQIFEYN